MYSGKIAVPPGGGGLRRITNCRLAQLKKKHFVSSDLDKLSLLLNDDEQTRTFYLLHFKIYN
jgi:hypothetical protein